MWNEGSILGPGEKPEARPHLQEMAEGRQISGVYWMSPDAFPAGFRAMGLEFTTSEALIIIAAPVLHPTYQVRLYFRWLSAQKIFTRSMARIYGQGLDRALADDFIKQQIQGNVIRYVYPDREPTPAGGERFQVEFTTGRGFSVEAIPSGPFCADLEVQMLERVGR